LGGAACERSERLEDAAQCLLVIIGATPEAKKELVGLIDGMRESAQSWKELLLDLKRRGLAVAPELAVADGAFGFSMRSRKYGRRPAANAAGCTRSPTC
jgi:transposase-like protein